MACLDTTVLVDLGRPRAKASARAFRKVEELAGRGETLATTRFNVAELYVGVARAGNANAERRAVQALLEDLEILEFGDPAARLFGQITAHLQAIGRPAGDMDVLIAATAMAAGHCLVTRNVPHFANIPALAAESY